MKTLTHILSGAFLLLLLCCSDPLNENGADKDLTLKKGIFGAIHEDGTVKVTVPFKIDLTVWNFTDPSDQQCGGYPDLFMTMKGSGDINQMGPITATFTFCCDLTTGVYQNTLAIFKASNGDELYASIPIGYIVPNTEENSNYYQSMFNDPMYITGGTGKFEGATGEATTHAYVHDPDPENTEDVWHTDFFSTGTITLIKGK